MLHSEAGETIPAHQVGRLSFDDPEGKSPVLHDGLSILGYVRN